ncbi:MAG: hypothetical protein ACE5I7_05455 [Candidatus Binatia bacterium]
MARACKTIGTALALLGMAVALVFVVVIVHDDAYGRAALAAERNPGNVMYEAQFGAAKVRRGFQLVGIIAGILLAVNGTTLVGLGVVAGRGGRKRKDTAPSGSP